MKQPNKIQFFVFVVFMSSMPIGNNRKPIADTRAALQGDCIFVCYRFEKNIKKSSKNNYFKTTKQNSILISLCFCPPCRLATTRNLLRTLEVSSMAIVMFCCFSVLHADWQQHEIDCGRSRWHARRLILFC